MLSAVEARKARLQRQGQGSHEPSVAPAPPAEPEPSPKAVSLQATSKPAKRRSVEKNGQRKRARGSLQVSPRERAVDVRRQRIDKHQASHSDSSADEDVSNARSNVPTADSTSVPQQMPKRAWSPSAPPPDSSDDTTNEDAPEGLDLDLLYTASQSQPRTTHSVPETLMSTFKPVVNQNVFHLSSHTVRGLGLPTSSPAKATLVSMSHGDTLSLLGAYHLTVLKGSVAFCGTTLSASGQSHRVFAPRSSPLPVIQSLSSDTLEWTEGLSIPRHILDACAGTGAAILLQELRTGVEGLEKICRTFDGVFTSPALQSGDVLGLQGVQIATHQTRSVLPMSISPSWDTAISNVLQHPRTDLARQVYVVRGPKNSGKSTFARTLLSQLATRYRRVAFLECDIGQSEFTPGGMVALNIVDQPVYGPPFTHPSIPYAAHFVGSTTPRSNPSHYLDCVRALVQTYNLDVQPGGIVGDDEDDNETDGRNADVVPMVVNTMGWSKGLGSELARKIEDIVEPSDIFEIGSANTDDEWAKPSSYDYDYRSTPTTTHHLEPVASSTLSSHFSAADRRTLSILSYFHAVFPPQATRLPTKLNSALSWTTSTPLCAHPPYEVDWNVAFDQVVFAGAGMEDIVPEEVPKVLTCSVVALVDCETQPLADTNANGVGTNTSLPYVQGASPPSPFHSTCRGLALIRSLSEASPSPVMHILTPLPPNILSNARVIVKGELELPIWGMLDFRTLDSTGEIAGMEKAKVPYLRWGKGEGAGGEKRRVRRNLMRRGQA